MPYPKRNRASHVLRGLATRIVAAAIVVVPVWLISRASMDDVAISGILSAMALLVLAPIFKALFSKDAGRGTTFRR